jgi:hypothetical protein
MKKYLVFVLVAVALTAIVGSVQAEAPKKDPSMVSHDVYFSLKDNSPQSVQKLIAACKKYLTAHPGAVRFSVGPLAAEMKRDVNDRDFDVALHLVFKDKAAHDAYQKAARHQQFIAAAQAMWKKVRVFDSYVEE